MCIEKKEKFVELRARGLSFSKISGEIGISKPTLINWSKELEIEIQNMRAIEWEALREKYQLTKEKRLLLFSESLDKIRKEISKRDLSDIPTEKLYYLHLKLLDKVKSEELIPALAKRGFFKLDISETKVWNT